MSNLYRFIESLPYMLPTKLGSFGQAISFMEKNTKLRIAVYNLQCAVCYCNDHIKTKL
jgi:hypothetical protein